MLKKIEIYLSPSELADEDFRRGRFTPRNLEVDLPNVANNGDRETIEKHLREMQRQDPTIFSRPRSLGCLYGAGEEITFGLTDFATYATSSRTAEEQTLMPHVYDQMRIMAVGGALISSDGYVLVHRRNKNASHMPGMLDSSVAGLCVVKEGRIDPLASLEQKLSREMGISNQEVLDIQFTGLHGARGGDLSGMYNFKIDTSVNKSTLDEMAKKIFVEHHLIKIEDLPSFIVTNFTKPEEKILDGAMVLSSILPKKEASEVLRGLSEGGIIIERGILHQGKFSQWD